MNLICLVGRLNEAPKCAQTKSNKDYATFALVVPHPFFDNSDSTLACVAWRKAFETAKDMKAGSLVALTGFIQQREYQGKNIVEINADKLEVLADGSSAKQMVEEEFGQDDPFADQ